MSTTWIYKRHVARVSNHGDPYIIVYTKTCCNNVHPREPNWCANLFGRMSEVWAKLISQSHHFDNGNCKGANGRPLTAEKDIRLWLQAFKKASKANLDSAFIPAHRRFSDTKSPEDLALKINRMTSFLSSVGAQYAVEEDVGKSSSSKNGIRLKMDTDENLAALAAMFSISDDSAKPASVWEVFESYGLEYWPQTEILTFPPTAPGKATEPYNLLRVEVRPHYEKTVLTSTETLVMGSDGQVLSVDALEWVCKNIAAISELSSPGKGALVALDTFRKKCQQLPTVKAEELTFLVRESGLFNKSNLYKWQINVLSSWEIVTGVLDVEVGTKHAYHVLREFSSLRLVLSIAPKFKGDFKGEDTLRSNDFAVAQTELSF